MSNSNNESLKGESIEKDYYVKFLFALFSGPRLKKTIRLRISNISRIKPILFIIIRITKSPRVPRRSRIKKREKKSSVNIRAFIDELREFFKSLSIEYNNIIIDNLRAQLDIIAAI
jgi:integrase